MTDLRKAAEMALETLERLNGWLGLRYGNELTPPEREVVKALRQALEQPEQEPVAWLHEKAGGYRYYSWQKQYENDTPLYTAPPSIEAAVLAEREACAKVCDEWNTAITDKLAAAIRARGEK